MTGFINSDVSHMYGNKHFALVRAVVSISARGEVVVNLQSRHLREKSPVHLTLSPADAVRMGEAMADGGRSAMQESVQ